MGHSCSRPETTRAACLTLTHLIIYCSGNSNPTLHPTDIIGYLRSRVLWSKVYAQLRSSRRHTMVVGLEPGRRRRPAKTHSRGLPGTAQKGSPVHEPRARGPY